MEGVEGGFETCLSVFISSTTLYAILIIFNVQLLKQTELIKYAI